MTHMETLYDYYNNYCCCYKYFFPAQIIVTFLWVRPGNVLAKYFMNQLSRPKVRDENSTN